MEYDRFTHKTRYFIETCDGGEFDVEECDKSLFESEKRLNPDMEVLTEKHTMFQNGCNQTCHTLVSYS